MLITFIIFTVNLCNFSTILQVSFKRHSCLNTEFSVQLVNRMRVSSAVNWQQKLLVPHLQYSFTNR